jgi:hypothetical protein
MAEEKPKQKATDYARDMRAFIEASPEAQQVRGRDSLELPVGDRHWIAMSSDNHDADRFRRQAGQCREKSARALSPVDATSWLRLAEDLLRLAEDFEKLREQKRLLSKRLRRQRALERRERRPSAPG